MKALGYKLLTAIMVIQSTIVLGQGVIVDDNGVGVNADKSAPDTSAILDIKSGTKGLLIPRMSSASRTGISSPATGLIVYDTSDSLFYYYSGSDWKTIASSYFVEYQDAGNLFIGNDAGNSTSGDNNIYIGDSSGFSNTTGDNNICAGNNSGYYFVASENIFIGENAGYGVTAQSTGTQNTVVGSFAGESLTSASSNSFFGYQAGQSNTSGVDNCFYGILSGISNTTGSQNVFMGRASSYVNTTGTDNTSIGYCAGRYNSTGNDNTFIGRAAGYYITADGNTVLGQDAGKGVISSSTGSYNCIMGYQSAYQLTTGTANILMGKDAGYYLTTGSYNAFLGANAGYKNTTASNNTYVGYGAGYNFTGATNVFVGAQSGKGAASSTGVGNASLGYGSAYALTTGDYNMIAGYEAGKNITTGGGNVILGRQAGYSNVSGSSNVFIGKFAGYNETGHNRLYIENTNTTTPLIYGEFNNDLVTIYGNLGVGATTFGSGTRTLALLNGTAPSSSITDGILLYSEDVSSSSELKVRDEAGNISTLSPHNFSVIPDGRSEEMAWAFYSERNDKIINVDMTKLARVVEKLSGENLVYIMDKNSDEVQVQDLSNELTKEEMYAIILDLQNRIEQLENR